MTKSRVFLVAALLLSVAACGGGGGTGGGGVVPGTSSSPPPSATPSPTPTPTPSGGATPAVAKGSGTPLSGVATFRGQAWAPYGIANGLDFPVQHGWDGSGQNVAIVIDSDVDRPTIDTYLAEFGLPAADSRITTRPVNGATGIATNGDQLEAYLDVETVAALAPGAHIYIYQIPVGLADSDIADAYSKIDSEGLAKVVNSSFGGCELASQPEDPFIASGAAAGVTYVASAGDSGNVCDGASQVGASYPASNPNVVAAGGTETSIANADPIAASAVWNDCAGNGSGQCAGGGGVSTYYALPAYQIGLAGAKSATKRNEPDISFPALDFVVYGPSSSSAQWMSVGGTSWSSPQYAALMAEVLQYCHLSAGLANPVTLPYFVESRYPKAYVDVISGNDEYGAATPFYTASAGYDNASGFGVPYGMAYANTACPGGVEASGLLRRTAIAAAAPRAIHGALDVTPRVSGLIDRGRRSQIANTRVQLILNSEADRSAVESALENAGFTIDRRYEYRQIVHAQAPAATVEQFFSTQLHDVEQARYGTRYMPVTQVLVPQSIASHVVTVNLDNVITRHVLSHEAPAWPLDALK